MHISQTLKVPGAKIYYEIQGEGPLLLISQSGEGDANRSVDLVRKLAADYRVITYDRRGLSRSKIDPSSPNVTMKDHVNDVHLLLSEIADEPVIMLGYSLGAVIGLHLAIDHPSQLSTLIAHEPVAPSLLPQADCKRQQDELIEVQDLYIEQGLKAAFVKIAAVLGIDPANQETEPDITKPGLDEQRIANFDFFIRHDFTAIAKDQIDITLLPDSSVRIIPTIGQTTPQQVFDYRCALELAKLLQTEAVVFPGGHNGNLTHPSAYADRIRELLAYMSSSSSQV